MANRTEKISGWVKLHRSLMDWEWYDDVPVKTLFLHLLLIANHEQKQWRGKTIEVGELITSLENLAKGSGLSVSQVRRAIKCLESTQEITYKPHRFFSWIKLNNYSAFQENTQFTTNKQQTKDKQTTTTKELKNIRNKEIDTTSPRFSVDDMALVDFFLECLRANHPGFKEPDRDRWAEEINRMVRIDGRTHGQIRWMISWTQNDSFWKSNILSPAKLREKFDQLVIRVKSSAEKAKSKGLNIGSITPT